MDNTDFYQLGWNLGKALYELGQQSAPPEFARKKSSRGKSSAKPTGRSYTRGAGKKKPNDGTGKKRAKPKCTKGIACGNTCIPANRQCSSEAPTPTAQKAAQYLKKPKSLKGDNPKDNQRKRAEDKVAKTAEKLAEKRRDTKTEDKPKGQVSKSDIPHNDFTRKWAKAWDEADVPQDLLRVIAKADPVNGTKGGGFFDIETRAIALDDYSPNSADGRSAYRHEFGHYLDAHLGGGIKGSIQQEKKQMAAMAEIAKMPLKDREREWDTVAQKAKEFLRSPEGRKAAESDVRATLTRLRKRARESLTKEERKRWQGKIDNIQKDVDAAIQGKIKTYEGQLDKGVLVGVPATATRLFAERFTAPLERNDLDADAAGLLERSRESARIFGNVEAENQWKTSPMASDTPSFARALKGDATRLLAEQKQTQQEAERLNLPKGATESDVLRRLYTEDAKTPDQRSKMARRAAEIAAQSDPALAVAKRIIDQVSSPKDLPDRYAAAFRPDGTPASREQLTSVLQEVAEAAREKGIDIGIPPMMPMQMMDLMGSTTNEKIGFGHGKAYYAAGKNSRTGVGQQATEVFANLTDMHAHSADTRALAQFLLPDQYREYQQILKNAGE